MKKQKVVILIIVSIFLCTAFRSGLARADSKETASDLLNSQTLEARVLTKLEKVESEIKKHGYRFKARYNPAMNYDIEQLCRLVEPANWQRDALFAQSAPALQALPSSFDWRDHNGVTPIRDQGPCGSCWAFSVVAPLESQIKIKCGDSVDLSEQYLVSCIGSQFGYDYSCAQGGWFNAHYYHQWYGAVLETEFPYVAADVACRGPYSYPYQIDSWSYLSGYGVPSVDAIKQAIYEHGPISAAICAGRNFSAYGSGIFDSDESNYCGGGVNHAIALVGWNDQEGYWILRNSWGTWWGENGYMKIAYNTSNVGYAANYIEFSMCAEPVSLTSTDVKVAKGNFDSDFAEEFATAELQSDSSVKITVFDDDGSVIKQFTTVTAREIALASGQFDSDTQTELVLAYVGTDGNLGARAYKANGTLLGTASGGKCSDVNVATGQFDWDSYDEYVVVVVQSDGTLAAITFNPNGTQVGVGVGGICSDLSVAVGNFDDNPSDDEYVISLLQSDGTLGAITFQGDGVRIGKGVGGLCSNVKVASGDFKDTNQQDEYVVSLIQSDGTLAAISFYANGTRIGKGVGGLCTNVDVASGEFYATDPMDGYVISLNQADNTPAAIFFKADGTRIGKGAGSEVVAITDIACADTDGVGKDNAVLAYINQQGIMKWIVFSESGWNLLSGP